MIETVVFILLALLTVVPAFLAVTLKNIFHCALFLILSLTGVAGLFALAGADFLFVSQLLVYAGGITVLLLFVVLLSGRPKDWLIQQTNNQSPWGIILAAIFVTLLAILFREGPRALSSLPAAEPTTASLGLLLIKNMVLPFEAVSLVLLAALVGAIHFSKKDSTK